MIEKLNQVAIIFQKLFKHVDYGQKILPPADAPDNGFRAFLMVFADHIIHLLGTADLGIVLNQVQTIISMQFPYSLRGNHAVANIG